MKTRKIPMRTCVVTKEKFPKGELIRVVRTPENQVVIDTTGRTNGHGAYLKKDKEVILKARNTKALDKYLEVSVPSDVFDDLISML